MGKGKQKQTKKDDDLPKPELVRESSTPPLSLNSFISPENRDWLSKNWKTLLIVTLCTVLVFVMKIHEESASGRSDSEVGENLYEVLGLDASCTLKDIKRQYNKLALELHPDKHPNCATCPERFQKISQAYEILSDDEKKLHYDQNAGILETIRSNSKPIYTTNWQKLVLESGYFWVVQVYHESSGACQTFSGFWEEYIEEYDYLKFGRINAVSQYALIPKLPYAIDELPFVFTMSQERTSDILEYNHDESPNTRFHAFIRSAIGQNHYTADINWIKKSLAKRPSQKTVFLAMQDNLPTMFSFLALKFRDAFSFYGSTYENRKAVAALLSKPKTSLVVFNEENLQVLPAVREFEVGYSKAGIKAVLSYMMFTSLPCKLNSCP